MKVSVFFRRAVISLAAFLCMTLPGSVRAESGVIVTSFFPIGLLADNLTAGVDDLEVINLAAPSTGCLHDYTLQTGDMKVLSRADVFLVNGAGMESYLDMVFEFFPELPVIVASDGVPLLYDGGTPGVGESERDIETPNAHIWLNPRNYILMAENLTRGLTDRYPDHKEALETNLSELTIRLEALDAELTEGLSALSRRDIITFHEAFPYFAEAYNLNVVAVVNKEPGETLTPSQLAQLTDLVKSLGNPPLFTEPQYADLSARILSEETGAPVYRLDPVVTPREDEVPLDYYEVILRENMNTLREALQ